MHGGSGREVIPRIEVRRSSLYSTPELMPTLEEVAYDGILEKSARLGLMPLLDEVRRIVGEFDLRVEERRDANGGAVLREMIDQRFVASGGWTKKQTGGVDWTKCHTTNGVSVCIGVEVQVSARSDMLVMDVYHLRDAMSAGSIDVGVLVVPGNELALYLTDRAPSLADAERHVKGARADESPLLVIGLRHDGAGEALPKKKKKRS